MLNLLPRLLAKFLDREEARLGVSLDYVRFMAHHSLGALRRFSKVQAVTHYYRSLPADAYHVAALVAARSEDCGSCVQLAVNMAMSDGVPTQVLKAVLDARPEELDERLADTYVFSLAVVERNGQEDEARERMLRHFGPKGLVELSLALASARFYPVVKRALGFSKSCQLVSIDLEQPS